MPSGWCTATSSQEHPGGYAAGNPNAHETDGCHFGVTIDYPTGPHLVLCC